MSRAYPGKGAWQSFREKGQRVMRAEQTEMQRPRHESGQTGQEIVSSSVWLEHGGLDFDREGMRKLRLEKRARTTTRGSSEAPPVTPKSGLFLQVGPHH